MKQLIPLTKRQNYILNSISGGGKKNTREILKEAQTSFDKVSRVTVIRDLNALMHKKLIRRSGKGRGVFYQTVAVSKLMRRFDVLAYFSREEDERTIQNEHIAFRRDSAWQMLFSQTEIHAVDSATLRFQKRLQSYNHQSLKRELERITIEFSWKSSHIEGNTYSLLETERLIKEHQETIGKKHAEAVMILNHKAALEYAWKYPGEFKSLSIRKIEELHTLIVKGLDVRTGIRKRPVGIVGTRYKPYDNIYQIREAVQELCFLINGLKHPFLKAAIAVAGISYIQPFEDGNKRTSRLVGNAILLGYRYCPLSYRSIDEIEYKKAMILFYEQHSLFAFKKLFLEQYQFAVENYFL